MSNYDDLDKTFDLPYVNGAGVALSNNCPACGRLMDEFDCCFTCDSLGTPAQQAAVETEAHSPRHTPGPWCWVNFGNEPHLATAHSGSKTVLDAVRKGQRDVAFRNRVTEGRSLMIPFDPSHPDSRLIAAAPELLDALRDLLDLVQFVRVWGSPSPSKRDTVIANANSVIALVEGK
ncbi:MAG: hypothetical protein ABIY70_24765 [Capsulimonas sp.]|uniref:hypothetical protein n=1 Tax=Capsulimonas sp. TaxID=2494211 RepID=UPI003264CB04